MLQPGVIPTPAALQGAPPPAPAFVAPPPPAAALSNDQKRRKALALALSQGAAVSQNPTTAEGLGSVFAKTANAYIANKPDDPMHNPMNWIPTVTPGGSGGGPF